MMSEEDLRIQQIKMKIKGLTFEQARDISNLCSEYYIEGLKQSRFDKRMLEQENQQLKEEIDNLNYIIDKQDRDITILSKGNKQLKEVIEEVREYADKEMFDYLETPGLLQILDKAKENK
jgi:DNA gyrase/topoisomerase IV subunit A